MQVSVEQQEGLERTLKVEIPGDRIDTAVEQRLNKLQGQVRLDGFRPGKVPLRVVRNRFGGQVRQEVMGELIQSTLQEAVDEVELQPAGTPRIGTPEEQPEQGGVAYTATFEVYPEVELGDPGELAIDKPVAEVNAGDIDRMLETLQRQRQVFTDVERAAEGDDRVVIDFTGYIDGEAFEGGSGQDTPVDLGAGRMVDDFEEQLVGIRAGDTREIEVTFPDDYGSAEVSGRTAVFEVACTSVQHGELPPVDEAFAQQFGIDSGAVDELREALRRNMERELKQALEAQVKKRVLDAVIEQNPIEVPDALVQEEIGRLREQMKQRVGGEVGDEQLPDELFRQEGTRRVRLGLLLQELVQRNSIQADEASVREKVEEMASAYDEPEQVVQYYFQNQEMLEGVKAMVVEDRVVDWIIERARVTEHETDFDAIMSEQNQSG